ncbi:Late embryogenesis abundant protein [Macleaya cordata]|uniref:Late embryogenesis abundant protein n=1 Tax=Macleaya cordata TaxID=56857 RepID=A0A200PR19_MACCD|nr:Late embryogenesis abundant protein [Macleaya cordata]OVA06401.1 Late embryogenesis abundant protein [Macleaya cordata]
MSSRGEQMTRKPEGKEPQKTETEKGRAGEGLLPLESSPYVKYSNLEDYKRQGYGTEGHLEPKPSQTGCPTDAPTPSGNALSATTVTADRHQGNP